ncbi:MAG: phosphate signaling complex protein PhoU [Verrucomicrobiota bacterium]
MNDKDKEYMKGIFRGPLLKFRETLLMMASLTDRNFTVAMNALLERDTDKAQLVESEDAVIDKLEVDLDDMVVKHLSMRGAAASDCRFMLGASKISEALENIADQSVSIARRVQKLNDLPEVLLDLEIPIMARTVLRMMREGIDALVDVDPDRVPEIVKMDKDIDLMNSDHEEMLNQHMREHPENVSQCIHYILISRSLERVGDYAKYIAQEVYYLYTAKDIRHVTVFD